MSEEKAEGASELKVQQLFKLMIENGASDLHLTTGSPPAIRINGDIVKVKLPALTPRALWRHPSLSIALPAHSLGYTPDMLPCYRPKPLML